MPLHQRPFAGAADRPAMAALVAAFPEQNLHVVDLPYRLCSWALDEPGNVSLWLNEQGELRAWALVGGIGIKEPKKHPVMTVLRTVITGCFFGYLSSLVRAALCAMLRAAPPIRGTRGSPMSPINYRPIVPSDYEAVRQFLAGLGWDRRVSDPARFAHTQSRTFPEWPN
jgi:hypothetical protein